MPIEFMDKYDPGERLTTTYPGSSNEAVEIYENCWIWTLENGVYRTAGDKYWKDELENGELKAGISIQRTIVDAHSHSDTSDLLVYDKQKNRHLLLDDYEDWSEKAARDTINEVPVYVIPVSCFTTIMWFTSDKTLFDQGGKK